MKLVAIKGMEMPKSCGLCKAGADRVLYHEPEPYCKLMAEFIFDKTVVHPDCPLIEVEVPTWRTDMENVPAGKRRYDEILLKFASEDGRITTTTVGYWSTTRGGKPSNIWCTLNGEPLLIENAIAWMPIPEFKE